MSYCRFTKGESDVYLLQSNKLMCLSCHLIEEPERYSSEVVFETRTQAIKHLEEHLASGQKVPKHAFARLRKEIKDIGDPV